MSVRALVTYNTILNSVDRLSLFPISIRNLLEFDPVAKQNHFIRNFILKVSAQNNQIHCRAPVTQSGHELLVRYLWFVDLYQSAKFHYLISCILM